MSVEPKSKTPDYKGSLEGGGLDASERGAIAAPLITKDKNLWTKTNIPDGFVMSVLDTFPLMAKPRDRSDLNRDRFKTFMDAWADFYRTDMMSENGWSTANYVAVASAPLSLTDMRMQQAQEERMKEGNKKG